MQRAIPRIVVCLAGLVPWAQADAAMIFTSLLRDTGGSSSVSSSTAQGAYVASASNGSMIVQQDTTISTSSLSGTLNGFSTENFTREASTVIHVNFDLSAPHVFTLVADLSRFDSSVLNSLGLHAITGSITPQGVPSLSASSNASLNETGILGPGSYLFTATVFSDGNETSPGSANVDFTFTVAAIPEPSSVVLLAIGCVGLGGYGWRRKRRAAA
jgi:hypothetical protein